jgi:hypothetical protein
MNYYKISISGIKKKKINILLKITSHSKIWNIPIICLYFAMDDGFQICNPNSVDSYDPMCKSSLPTLLLSM